MKNSSNDSLISKLIQFSLERKMIVFLFLLTLILGGLSTAPFDWKLGFIPRNPVAVDAIPDIGENQQIVFTEWKGRSPQDIENQITYPLTTQLMGVPGVKTIRSYSYFGFSSVYIIFEEDVEFYYSRSRILEKLASLPANLLPNNIQPTLGPDATSLGQVFWYNLEAQDANGNPTGGWDIDELKAINDFQIRYALQGVKGVAEVSMVGGAQREYQIDLSPEKLRHYNISLEEVYKAVSESNKEVGARTVEINRVEYIVRAKGYVKSLDDLKQTVIKTTQNQAITLSQVAHIHLGPAPRRGALNKGGADVTGGVVVARYGENPLQVIEGVEAKIAEISKGLPSKTLTDGTFSQVKIVPFYNRKGLINETLNTLKKALSEEVLITLIVILFMLGHLRSSLLISIVLPIAVLGCFILMKLFGVDANVVALSGIAIAIGTMVDMAIIISENIFTHLEKAKEEDSKTQIVFRATREVSGSVITSVLTTLISFLPVFTLTAAEGKLFKPLAFTKTFALMTALTLALFVIPPLAALLFKKGKTVLSRKQRKTNNWFMAGVLILLTFVLTKNWLPLGPSYGLFINLIFVAVILFSILFSLKYFIQVYPKILRLCLNHRLLFLTAPLLLLIGGFLSWRSTPTEFMPSLDEGSYLLMPTTMPHASFEEAQEQLSLMDQLLEQIPEVEMAVGKLGRVESALDPAPPSMYEITINYKNKYSLDSNGNQIRNWRDHIKNPDDIWKEIIKVTQIPGVTSAPKLMPIETRIVMLQSGMKAPMGIKIKGPDINTIESFGIQLETLLKKWHPIEPNTVIADRIVGKPYLEFEIDRQKAARFGLSIASIQNTLMTAVGGRTASYTVEGRERFPIRVRYQREKRDNLKALNNILIRTSTGAQIPVSQIASLRFTKGPMVIKSEDGFLVSYVVFDKVSSLSETSVVQTTQSYLDSLTSNGSLKIPEGVSYQFTGNYENQVRSNKSLMLILPISLLLIFLIIYFQFNKVSTVLIIYSGVLIAWAGGFLLIGLYNTDWFLNIQVFNLDLREIFQVHTVNISVAVWVGFIALAGIATDDGVVMSEYISQQFKQAKPNTKADILEAIIKAATRRIRPCMMTTSTTLLALIPIFTSTGRGSDIMIPMSIPIFGGMLIVIISAFVVPVLTSMMEEWRIKKAQP